jgi:hypothetical protein
LCSVSPCWYPQSPEKGCFLSSLSLSLSLAHPSYTYLSPSYGQAVVCPSPIGSLALTLFPTGPAKALNCLTGSHISNLLLVCCLLIALMLEAVSTSEMSVNFYYTTWRNNPEDSHLHTHCHKNLKSHLLKKFQICFLEEQIVIMYNFGFRGMRHVKC